MTIDTKKKVGEIAAEVPGAVKVLDTWGVDYCCRGNQPFEKACAAAGAPLKILRETLEAELLPSTGDGSSFKEWRDKSLADLIQYILRRHHSYTRDQGRRLRILANRILSQHEEDRPGPPDLKTELEETLHRLEDHMTEEEDLVFPIILKAEKAIAGGNQWIPPAGTEDYLETLRVDHTVVNQRIQKMRRTAHRLSALSGNCGFQREFFDGLLELERDFHHHVHLENNILFRRAQEAGMLA